MQPYKLNKNHEFLIISIKPIKKKKKKSLNLNKINMLFIRIQTLIS